MSVLCQAFNGWLYDFTHDPLVKLLRDDRCRRISPHATGIWPLVFFITRFVVLGRSKWQRKFSINEADKTCFFTHQTFLDNDSISRTTECSFPKALVNRVYSYLLGCRDGYALPRCQAISFNYTWPGVLFDPGNGLIRIIKNRVGGGGYAVSVKK